MTNSLIKDFTTTVVQPPDVTIRHPAVTTTVSGTNTLTASRYAYYKSLIYAGADYTYVIDNSGGSVFDAWDNIINGYYVQFLTAQVVQYGNGNPVAIPNSAIVFGATTTHTEPAYTTTFTPLTQTQISNLVGWDGSAASDNSFAADGHVAFSIKANSWGVVCGLNQLGGETGSDYQNIDFAIYASKGFFQISENGITKTPKIAFTDNSVFIIQRQSTAVQYLLDGAVVLMSAVSSTGAMVLDASLYVSADEIDNASIASALSSYGWIADSAFYLGSQVSVTATGTNNPVNVTFTGTGTLTDGGTGTFTGTYVSATSYTGSLTGTFTDTLGVSHTGTFTGTYNLVNGVWVFSADEGWTWASDGVMATNSGTATFTGTQVTATSYVGAITGTVVDAVGVSHTGTFTGTYDLVGDKWVFTADEGWTWGALGTPVSNGNSVFTGVESFPSSGIWAGTITGSIRDTLGVLHTGTFAGTAITADGQLTWTFTASAGWTATVSRTTVNNGTPLVNGVIPLTGIVSPATPPSLPTNIFYDYLLDVMVYSDYYAPQSNFTLSLTDTTVYADYYDTGKGMYLAIVQSTENQAITTYSNMPFDGSCNFNGKTLFFNESGLFEYGGTTDNGTTITASIKTDNSNKIAGQGGMYSTQHRKKISSCKIDINMDKSADALLSVTYNNDTALSYSITNQKTGLEVYHGKIGRGQKGGYNSIQLELSGFDILESIEFDADILPSGRRGNRE